MNSLISLNINTGCDDWMNIDELHISRMLKIPKRFWRLNISEEVGGIKPFCPCELSPWIVDSAGIGIWMIGCDNGLPNANELNSVSASGSDPPDIPNKLLLHTNSLSTKKSFLFQLPFASPSPSPPTHHAMNYSSRFVHFHKSSNMMLATLAFCLPLFSFSLLILVFLKDSLIFLFITPK